MDLVARVKAILLTPKTEWIAIDGETGDAHYLFTNYVAILAAIPAVATFIGYSVAGLGFGRGLLLGIFSYVISCVAWYVAAWVIDALAPTFGGVKNLGSALKLSTYSWTASWIAGIFHLIPGLSVLGIIAGLYSLYLLWLGVPVLMKAPPDRATPYTAAIIVIMVVFMVIVSAVLFRLVF
jgi:Yip1-like protein